MTTTAVTALSPGTTHAHLAPQAGLGVNGRYEQEQWDELLGTLYAHFAEPFLVMVANDKLQVTFNVATPYRARLGVSGHVNIANGGALGDFIELLVRLFVDGASTQIMATYNGDLPPIAIPISYEGFADLRPGKHAVMIEYFCTVADVNLEITNYVNKLSWARMPAT